MFEYFLNFMLVYKSYYFYENFIRYILISKYYYLMPTAIPKCKQVKLSSSFLNNVVNSVRLRLICVLYCITGQYPYLLYRKKRDKQLLLHYTCVDLNKKLGFRFLDHFIEILLKRLPSFRGFFGDSDYSIVLQQKYIKLKPVIIVNTGLNIKQYCDVFNNNFFYDFYLSFSNISYFFETLLLYYEHLFLNKNSIDKSNIRDGFVFNYSDVCLNLKLRFCVGIPNKYDYYYFNNNFSLKTLHYINNLQIKNFLRLLSFPLL